MVASGSETSGDGRADVRRNRIAALVAWLCRGQFPIGMDPLHAALKAFPVAAIAVVSDLIESVIKRRADIKDSGMAIPGIGGIFDTLTTASPLRRPARARALAQPSAPWRR